MAKSSKPGVTGPYKKPNGTWEVRVVGLDGKQKSYYRKEKRLADALAKQLSTKQRNIAAASDDDIDWYALLRKTARAAFDAGDYTAVVSAAKAAVTFMPAPAPKDPIDDLSKASRDQLIANVIRSLRAEGYNVTKQQPERN